MATTPIVIDPGTELPNAVATQYTAPVGKIIRIASYAICETTNAAITYTIHLVPSGGSASDANMIANAVSVAAKKSVLVVPAIGQVLEAGDTIQAFASTASALTQRVSGYSLDVVART